MSSTAFEIDNDILSVPENDASPLIPKSLTATPDVKPLICAYPGCTNGITKPARGRPSKYCDEHKAGTRTSGRASAGGWARAKEVEESLKRYVPLIGGGISILNEVDGVIVASGLPDVIHELVELAKTDKQLRKYLEWIATPGKYGPLTMAVMGMVLPILANHDLIPKIEILRVKIPDSGGEN